MLTYILLTYRKHKSIPFREGGYCGTGKDELERLQNISSWKVTGLDQKNTRELLLVLLQTEMHSNPLVFKEHLA